MTDRKPDKPQKPIREVRRRPTLEDVWPVHSAGGWPQGRVPRPRRHLRRQDVETDYHWVGQRAHAGADSSAARHVHAFPFTETKIPQLTRPNSPSRSYIWCVIHNTISTVVGMS